MLIKLAVFIVATALILYISRSSLRVKGSHGFYRFFAWELILVLFLLNVEQWFKAPFTTLHIISWLLLMASLIPLFTGVRSLKRSGQQVEERGEESELYAFERTTKLVTSGVYRYIRHPLYSSLLLLTWAIIFKDVTLYTAMLGVAASLLLYATARADEAECIRYFGSEYEEYMKRSRCFLPFLF